MSNLQEQAKQYAAQQNWNWSMQGAPPPPPGNPPLPSGQPPQLSTESGKCGNATPQTWAPGFDQWSTNSYGMQPGWQGAPAQWTGYNWSQPYYGAAAPPPVTANGATAMQAGKPAYNEANDPEIAEFDKQFKDWEQKFDAWKEENKNHPDKAALANYEETWTKWKEELLQKREDMKKSKQTAVAAKPPVNDTQPPAWGNWNAQTPGSWQYANVAGSAPGSADPQGTFPGGPPIGAPSQYPVNNNGASGHNSTAGDHQHLHAPPPAFKPAAPHNGPPPSDATFHRPPPSNEFSRGPPPFGQREHAFDGANNDYPKRHGGSFSDEPSQRHPRDRQGTPAHPGEPPRNWRDAPPPMNLRQSADRDYEAFTETRKDRPSHMDSSFEASHGMRGRGSGYGNTTRGSFYEDPAKGSTYTEPIRGSGSAYDDRGRELGYTEAEQETYDEPIGRSGFGRRGRGSRYDEQEHKPEGAYETPIRSNPFDGSEIEPGYRKDQRGERRGAYRGTDRGAFRGSDRGAYRGSDRGAYRGSDRGAYQESDRGAFRGSDRGAYRGSDRGAYQESDRGAFRGSDRGAYRGSDRGSSYDGYEGGTSHYGGPGKGLPYDQHPREGTYDRSMSGCLPPRFEGQEEIHTEKEHLSTEDSFISSRGRQMNAGRSNFESEMGWKSSSNHSSGDHASREFLGYENRRNHRDASRFELDNPYKKPANEIESSHRGEGAPFRGQERLRVDHSSYYKNPVRERYGAHDSEMSRDRYDESREFERGRATSSHHGRGGSFGGSAEDHVPFSNLSLSLRDSVSSEEVPQHAPSSQLETGSHNRYPPYAVNKDTKSGPISISDRRIESQNNNQDNLRANNCQPEVAELFQKASAGNIPGLDISAKEAPVQPVYANVKKAETKPAVAAAKKADPVESTRLNIGPIGVSQKEKWKPPTEWYDDEDDTEYHGKRPRQNDDQDQPPNKFSNIDNVRRPQSLMDKVLSPPLSQNRSQVPYSVPETPRFPGGHGDSNPYVAAIDNRDSRNRNQEYDSDRVEEGCDRFGPMRGRGRGDVFRGRGRGHPMVEDFDQRVPQGYPRGRGRANTRLPFPPKSTAPQLEEQFGVHRGDPYSEGPTRPESRYEGRGSLQSSYRGRPHDHYRSRGSHPDSYRGRQDNYQGQGRMQSHDDFRGQINGPAEQHRRSFEAKRAPVPEAAYDRQVNNARPPLREDHKKSPLLDSTKASNGNARTNSGLRPEVDWKGGRQEQTTCLPEQPKSNNSPPQQTSDTHTVATVSETITVDDLITVPGRFMRPPKVVILFRGLPGSGKTTLAKMIKDKEIENGGSAPRILCLDDYFMVESEKMVTDSETGRKSKCKAMEYEYEPELEDTYRTALIKSFKKQVDEKFFPFIIIDSINCHQTHFKEICDYSKKNGFEPYIAEVEADVHVCSQRNVHGRKAADIQQLFLGWQKTPAEYTRLDLTSYIQDANIQDVEMEDSVVETKPDDKEGSGEEESAQSFTIINDLMKSKWDTMESQEAKLDKLDGVKTAKKRLAESNPQSIDDWLQLSKEFEERTEQPGKKRVRWADMEERKKQESARDRGFVLGQTDWQRMTDPSLGSSALVKVKYF